MRTIHEAARAIRAGEITPVTLVEECLAAIDAWEHHVKAWVFVDRDGALAEARRLTDELRRGLDRGPLHGIPLGVKDIIDVFDWPTAAGSKLWANSIARQDADVIANLRQAGAIFLGKTVTTQYASFDPPVTRNPWDLSRTPGGSSSGSAVAVATGMCLGALGTQTGGSLTRPASYCGVMAYKPNYGLVSTKGVVPLAHSMDHVGPMARCVKDLAILLQGMVHLIHLDECRRIEPYQSRESEPRLFTCSNSTFGLFDDREERAAQQGFDELWRSLSKVAALTVGYWPGAFAEVNSRHRIVMAVEAAQFHRERMAKHPGDYQPRIRQLLEEGLSCSAVEYAACKDYRLKMRVAIQNQMRAAGVLLMPATTTPAPDAATTGNPAFNSPWSYLGLPTVSMPTGQFIEGLPLAVQLVTNIGNEGELFSVATWLEEHLAVGPLSPPLPA